MMPNEKRYKQVKVSLTADIAEEFKERCEAAGVSMASEISRFMNGQKSSRNYTKPVSVKTRQLRRKATFTLIQQLEAIPDAELQYKYNIPINLQNASMYETAEQAVSAPEEALNSLHQAY
jgi:hypothetical protein